MAPSPDYVQPTLDDDEMNFVDPWPLQPKKSFPRHSRQEPFVQTRVVYYRCSVLPVFVLVFCSLPAVQYLRASKPQAGTSYTYRLRERAPELAKGYAHHGHPSVPMLSCLLSRRRERQQMPFGESAGRLRPSVPDRSADWLRSIAIFPSTLTTFVAPRAPRHHPRRQVKQGFPSRASFQGANASRGSDPITMCI